MKKIAPTATKKESLSFFVAVGAIFFHRPLGEANELQKDDFPRQVSTITTGNTHGHTVFVWPAAGAVGSLTSLMHVTQVHPVTTENQ